MAEFVSAATNRLRFCIRDDDTNFFTTPDDLERAYAGIVRRGPVSLAVVPYCRAGTNKAVPERFRRRWSVHPLHENRELVAYLRESVSAGAFEIMEAGGATSHRGAALSRGPSWYSSLGLRAAP